MMTTTWEILFLLQPKDCRGNRQCADLIPSPGCPVFGQDVLHTKALCWVCHYTALLSQPLPLPHSPGLCGSGSGRGERRELIGHCLCDCKCRKPHSNFSESCIRVVSGVGLTSGTVGSRSSSYSIRNIFGLLSLSSAILWGSLVLRPALSHEEAQAGPRLPPLRPSPAENVSLSSRAK